MLHHASFNAQDPQTVAQVLARIVGGHVLRAPIPPFPDDSWFVCTNDELGSYLEILPVDRVFDQERGSGLHSDPQARRTSGVHLLVSSPLSADQVLSVAAEAGWKADFADLRLFRIARIWVENSFLIEVLTPEHKADYLKAFGSAGAAMLDAKLRGLEAAVTQARQA